MQDVRQLSRHLFTHSKTDGPTEQDKAQYPIHRPDHVFVYQGPLSQTVSRLKVGDTSSANAATKLVSCTDESV